MFDAMAGFLQHIPAIFSEKYMKGSEEKVGVKVGNGEKIVWEMKVTRS